MKRTIGKLVLDSGMIVLYCLLMFASNLGEWFHEIVGIAVGGLFLLHVLLNRKESRALWKHVRNGGAGWQKTAMVALDWLLYAMMPAAIVTGAVISTELFQFSISDSAWSVLFLVHDLSSWAGLFALGTHLLLHVRYIAGVVRISWKKGGAGRVFASGAAALMAAGVLYVAVANAFSGNYSRDVVTPVLPSASPESSQSAGETEEASAAGGEKTQASDSTAAQEETGESSDASTDKKKEQQSASTQQEDSQQKTTGTGGDGVPTLSQFLGALTCSGCGRHCLLTNPHCGRGEQRAEEKTEEYYETYGTAASDE